jgi:hypothetical protein
LARVRSMPSMSAANSAREMVQRSLSPPGQRSRPCSSRL